MGHGENLVGGALVAVAVGVGAADLYTCVDDFGGSGTTHCFTESRGSSAANIPDSAFAYRCTDAGDEFVYFRLSARVGVLTTEPNAVVDVAFDGRDPERYLAEARTRPSNLGESYV